MSVQDLITMMIYATRQAIRLYSTSKRSLKYQTGAHLKTVRKKMKTQKEFDECLKRQYDVGYSPSDHDIEFYKIYWEACEKAMIDKLKNCNNCKYEFDGVYCSAPHCDGYSSWEMEEE